MYLRLQNLKGCVEFFHLLGSDLVGLIREGRDVVMGKWWNDSGAWKGGGWTRDLEVPCRSHALIPDVGFTIAEQEEKKREY